MNLEIQKAVVQNLQNETDNAKKQDLKTKLKDMNRRFSFLEKEEEISLKELLKQRAEKLKLKNSRNMLIQGSDDEEFYD
jgi:hypothetical protein